MLKKVCPDCQKPVRQLKHSIICQCGPKILFVNKKAEPKMLQKQK